MYMYKVIHVSQNFGEVYLKVEFANINYSQIPNYNATHYTVITIMNNVFIIIDGLLQ